MFTERGWIMKRAALSPNRTALVDVHTGESWTYAMLQQRDYSMGIFFQSKMDLKKGNVLQLLLRIVQNCSPSCLLVK